MMQGRNPPDWGPKEQEKPKPDIEVLLGYIDNIDLNACNAKDSLDFVLTRTDEIREELKKVQK